MLKKSFERQVKMELKTSREKKVIRIIERSLYARISPIPSDFLKYVSILYEMAKIPAQKAEPLILNRMSLLFAPLDMLAFVNDTRRGLMSMATCFISHLSRR